MVKNPNWQEADQLAIYKHDRELNSRQPRANPDSGLNGTCNLVPRVSLSPPPRAREERPGLSSLALGGGERETLGTWLRDLNPGPLDIKSGALPTRPRCLGDHKFPIVESSIQETFDTLSRCSTSCAYPRSVIWTFNLAIIQLCPSLGV